MSEIFTGRSVMEQLLRSQARLAPQGRSRGQDGSAHLTLACPIHRAGGSDDSDPTKPRRREAPNVTAGPRRCPPERGLKIIGYLVAGVVLLTCAGCDKAGPADGDPPSSSTSTSAVPTTVAPSSESTSTAAGALARAERDLRTAQAGYYAAYMAAVAKPNNAQALAHLLQVYKDGSPGRRGMQKYVKTLAKSGFAARRGPKSGFTVESVDVSSVAEGSAASVLVCTYDDGTTYDAKHDGPDGKPIVIDDSITSAQTKFRYLLQAGRWKLTGGDVLKTWDGENRCSAKA